MSLIISRTQSNNRTCAYALTNYGAQLILACTTSIMPGLELSLGFFPFLAHSRIFASRSHLTVIFTWMETPSSPLSSYVHSILLCYLPSMMRQTCVALLMRALTNLHPCRRRDSGIFSISGNYVAFSSLCLLSGTAHLGFFSLFCETRDNMFQPLKIDT